MRKRTKIAVAVVLLAALGFAAWEGFHEREPEYGGKTLTAWLDESTRAFRGPPPLVSQDEARNAIRQMGTNALPTLLKMVQAKDSALKKKAIAFLKKHPAIKLRLYSEQELRAWSSSGFAALRGQAKPAVPALIKLLKHRDADTRISAGFGLMWIGPDARDAVPALVDCLDHDPNGMVTFRATRCLREIHAMPQLAVPALIRSLEKRSVPERETIAALVAFGPEGKAAGPVICRMLEEQKGLEGQTRCGLICVLERIGADEGPATKAISRALNDPDEQVRREATNFFLHYAPAAAAKAGVDTNALLISPGAPDPHGLRLPVVR